MDPSLDGAGAGEIGRGEGEGEGGGRGTRHQRWSTGAAAADRWDRGDSAAHRDGRTAEKWTPTIGT
jgi:hypothetical protein